MSDHLEKNEQKFLVNIEDAIERVKQGSYAFLMESQSVEYQVGQDCRLLQVGELMNTVSYGIGLTQGTVYNKGTFISLIFSGSKYRKVINKAILKMQDDGSLKTLKDKWWGKKLDCKVWLPAY